MGTTIDIRNLETSFRNRMSDQNKFREHKCCIFRTPNILARHNKEAYVPDAFSIGPMHHGDRLAGAERIKSLYLGDFLGRSTKETTLFRFQDFSLTTVIEAVWAVETEARACYAEAVKFTPEEFVEILVMDGCFLIELLCRAKGEFPDDPIQTMACLTQYLYHDLVLLENQIPWLVLEAIYNKTIIAGPVQTPPLKRLVVYFFGHHFSTINMLPEPATDKFNHILDLLRKSLISTFKKGNKNDKWTRIPSAVELMEAGVTLANKQTGLNQTRPNQTGPDQTGPDQAGPNQTGPDQTGLNRTGSIFNVEFKNGVLYIPNIIVHETTEATFRNLICYEQCYPRCEPKVTSYAVLMDNLIETSKDLEKLCGAGIVSNWLDPQDATKMFNNLYNDANVTEFYYMDMCDDVERFCQRFLPRWRAGYVHNYFSTPWAIVSQVVGTVLLVLTILQTYYTIVGD